MSELTNLEKIRRLPWQLAGNAFNMVFWVTAAAGSVFILFLNELGLDKAKIGFLLSLLPFCGISAIFTAPYVAKFGYKRIFLIFFGARKIFTASLLFTPLIISAFGSQTGFVWVSCCIFGFAMCRAISETAIFPWMQEVVPDNIRGKFSSFSNIINQLLSVITIAISGYIIGHYEGINKFVCIIAAGVLCGLVSVWCFFFVPGGKPAPLPLQGGSSLKEMLSPLKDNNFRNYMTGLAFVTVGICSTAAFIPLYMKEQVGLSSEYVVWLDIGMYSGALLSSFMWGWTSDRFGSKPVMLSGPYLMLPLPLLCFIMPRNSMAASQVAVIITFLLGVANTAWGIGLGRYLYVNAVPAAKKTAYMAVFYAGAGLAGGIAPLLAGRLLKAGASINTKFLFFTVDSYTPLFALSIVLLLIGAFFVSKIRADGALPMKRFVGMFIQGNPFMAVGSLLRYYKAPDEEVRVSITNRLGFANSPLSNHELIEALNDPSFNVRYEAIIAIANSRPAPELVDALVLVLGGNEPDLSVNAAWALGRIGDETAVFALRETLLSDYPLLKARSARALATLGDKASIPLFIELFRSEEDPGLKIAYAQSLGKLRYPQIIDEMLEYLCSLEDPLIRSEMGLALARIIGNESDYISIWRQLKNDLETSAAKITLSLKSDVTNSSFVDSELKDLAAKTCNAFARADNEQAAKLMSELADSVSKKTGRKPVEKILQECSKKLKEFGLNRIEYIILGLYCCQLTLNKKKNGNKKKQKLNNPPE
ncbi:MAG: MFS transporter [Sedimentisphaeraceae bacterium JB056]